MPEKTVSITVGQWVDALRSGKFFQGREALVVSDPKGKRRRYCCLGVACKIAGTPFRQFVDEIGIPISVVTYEEGCWGGLGLANEDLVAARRKRPVTTPFLRKHTLTVPVQVTDLIELNDKYKASFREIADAIEAGFKRSARIRFTYYDGDFSS